MGRPCLLCSADEGSWLVLEISSRPDGASYRLRHRDIAQGTLLPREPITDTWEICRYGHMRRVAQAQPPAPNLAMRLIKAVVGTTTRDEPGAEATDDPTVVQILGSTGGGKSQIVRGLWQEVLPPSHLGAPEIAPGQERQVRRVLTPEMGQRFTTGSIEPTADYRETARQRLTTYLGAISDDVAATDRLEHVLRQALLLENPDPTTIDYRARIWGNTRAPYLFRSSHGGRQVTTALVDLPGEIIDRLTHLGDGGVKLGRTEKAQLNYSHHFLGVLDALSLSSVYHQLTDPERLACSRVRAGEPGRVFASTRQQAHELLRSVLLMSDGDLTAMGHAKLSIALSKGDAIHRALSRNPVAPGGQEALSRWAWAFRRPEAARDFQGAAADAVLAALDHYDPEYMSASARQLLGGLLDEPDRFERARLASELALAVLDHFGSPANFWGLVATDSYPPLSVGGREVAVETSERYWFAGADGSVLQARDIVSAVLSSALLGADFGRNLISTLNATAAVRFVLTCTREFVTPDGQVRQVGDPDAVIPSNAGLLHLMAVLFQEPGL